ncbi:SPFH domain-containing protein, partial [Bacteroides thetaiotaomicron]|nr:SPFH domain-containing protein [Bacteroides thetaiotaomicron]
VSMVESALGQLEAREIVELDPERRAAMVSNLLVVLCSVNSAAPVINAGSLYS